MQRGGAGSARGTAPGARTGEEAPAPPGLQRGRLTWLCYGALGSFAFWLYCFGPAVALLRHQLHFSYTLVGAYSALWAGGSVGAALSFVALARRMGRRAVLWGGALATSAGAALFIAGTTVTLTALAALVMGWAGTLVLAVVQSALSDRHGGRKDQAMVEANIGAGACAVVAPVLLGQLGESPLGWKAAMALPALALGVLFIVYYREPLPAGEVQTPTAGRALPLACWLLGALVAVGMGIEFCVIYFGSEQLYRDGLHPAAASTAMSCFYAGLLAGRVVAGRATRQSGRGQPLLWASLIVTGAGFLAFWLTTSAPVALVGLAVCGAGTANLYPLSLVLMFDAAPGRTDAANALSQLLGGAMVVVAPLVLGALADALGLAPAFGGVEVVLIVSACVLLPVGTRSARRAS